VDHTKVVKQNPKNESVFFCRQFLPWAFAPNPEVWHVFISEQVL